MRISETHSHLQAIQVLRTKGEILDEITFALNDPELMFGREGPKEIKRRTAEKLNALGWADRVKVLRNSQHTISFMKNRVGVCLQLGNVARVYADLLKLTLMGNRELIDVGVIAVPDQLESKLMGANYARYDRLLREMQEFAQIVNLPVLAIGLSN